MTTPNPDAPGGEFAHDSAAMFRPPSSAAGAFPPIPGIEPVRIIGRGAWSTVWMARQLRPVFRDVAVKVLDPAGLGPEPLARFLREWDALVRAAGTGAATLIDAGHTPDGRAYLVMELVGGESITAACERRSLALSERLAILAQLATIVARVHARGLVHRDLKPSNVLVTFDAGWPTVTLLDFGLARITGPVAEESLTRQGVPLGTPEWMAPEQTGLLDAEVGPRADVYSLGLLVERLWVGRTRWSRSDGMLQERAAAVTNALRGVIAGRFAPSLPPDPAPTWDDLAPPQRERLAGLVRSATAPDPAHRTIDSAAIARDLHELAGDGRPERVAALSETRETTSRRARAAGVLLAFVAAVLFFVPAPDDPRRKLIMSPRQAGRIDARSVVRAGIRESGATLGSADGWQLVADSEADHSGEQGRGGWFYGYADGVGEPGPVFELPYFSESPDCGCKGDDINMWHFGETPCFCSNEFCYITATRQHGDTVGKPHVPVRRYYFPAVGTYRIDASFLHRGGCGGVNPTAVALRHNGKTLWDAQTARAEDGTYSTVNGSVTITVTDLVGEGSFVDLWSIMLTSECDNVHEVSLRVFVQR